MLNNKVRILNFDNSITRQNDLIARFNPTIIELQKIAPSARLWLDKNIEKEIKDILCPDLKNAVTFLGSGDFHHISSLLIEQFSEPISVIVFDAHPDWDILPPRTGCGSWVSRILKKTNIKKVILLGTSSDDIATFNIQTANLMSLKNSRLEIYPYQSRLTKVILRDIPENLSVEVRKGLLCQNVRWQQLKDKNLSQFSAQLIARLESKQVYVSIDKDCLRSEHSLTNWEEGSFSLSDLLAILKAIRDNADIVGIDITGDYSPVKIKGIIKSICSHFDHPGDYSAKARPDSLVKLVNEQTNISILENLINCSAS